MPSNVSHWQLITRISGYKTRSDRGGKGERKRKYCLQEQREAPLRGRESAKERMEDEEEKERVEREVRDGE